MTQPLEHLHLSASASNPFITPFAPFGSRPLSPHEALLTATALARHQPHRPTSTFPTWGGVGLFRGLGLVATKPLTLSAASAQSTGLRVVEPRGSVDGLPPPANEHAPRPSIRLCCVTIGCRRCGLRVALNRRCNVPKWNTRRQNGMLPEVVWKMRRGKLQPTVGGLELLRGCHHQQ